jgi:hypothetical protein
MTSTAPTSPEIIAARAELVAAQELLSGVSIVETDSRTAASSAAADYSDDQSAARLKAFRETRDRAEADAARLTFARARAEKCTRELAALEQGLADNLAAEERARDLAALALLEARIGRAHFRLTIAPDVAELVAARLHVEAVLARIRSVGEEQVEARALALTLAEKHGAPAPVEAVDADTGERIALVETHLAMLAAYPGAARSNAADLSEWIFVPSDLEAFAAWVVRFLTGAEHIGPRGLVTPAETIEAVLAEGRDTMAAVEKERGTVANIAATAARTDRMKDPIFLAHAAAIEASRSLAAGRWAHPLRAEELRRFINAGRAALVPLLAPAHRHELYTAPGEQGAIRLNAGGLCSRADNILGIGDNLRHLDALRTWLGDTKPFHWSEDHPEAPPARSVARSASPPAADRELLA